MRAAQKKNIHAIMYMKYIWIWTICKPINNQNSSPLDYGKKRKKKKRKKKRQMKNAIWIITIVCFFSRTCFIIRDSIFVPELVSELFGISSALALWMLIYRIFWCAHSIANEKNAIKYSQNWEMQYIVQIHSEK